MTHKRFVLNRLEDESGISGTGIVAEGIQFSTKKCAIGWCSDSEVNSVATYDNIDHVEKIHGHDGKTVIRWIDI